MHGGFPKEKSAGSDLTALFAKGTPTLEDVCAHVNVRRQTETRRRDLISSLHRVAAAFGLPLCQLPANVAWLRAQLASLPALSLGKTDKTRANIRSNALAALEIAGLVLPRHNRTPLSPEWRALWGKLSRSLKLALGSFARFCSHAGISPAAASDQHVRRFADALALASLRKEPARALYYLTTGWNKAATSISGWPTQRLTVPKRRLLIAPPEDILPKSFRDDLENYIRRMQALDPLDPDAPPRALAPATLAHRRRQIRRFFGELTQSGVNPQDLPDLRAMVRPEMARRGLGRMYDQHNRSTSGMIHGMAYTLLAIAKHYARLPEQEVRALRAFCAQLKPKQEGMTAKNRARLRQLNDPAQLRRILLMHEELLAVSKAKALSPKKAALAVETALAIELLVMTGLRIKNLARLRLDENFLWSRSPWQGVCHLVIEARDVKNGEHLEFELNGETIRILQTFVRNHRSVLLPAGCPWLFGRRDRIGPADESVLGNRISRTIRKRTGMAINPHLFRALAGKLFLDRNPGQYESVRRWLGHKNISTTLTAYTGEESVSAAKHFDQNLRSLRDDARRWNRTRGGKGRG